MHLPIRASERAFRRLAEIRSDSEIDAPVLLRVSVLGGGCSGFSYDYALATDAEPGDLEISDGSNTFLVDEVSRPLLEGAVIDFEEALIGARFAIANPNAASSCGCGVSFSI